MTVRIGAWPRSDIDERRQVDQLLSGRTQGLQRRPVVLRHDEDEARGVEGTLGPLVPQRPRPAGALGRS
ncbi:hypothetical protein IMF23_17630 [Chelatococcus daeguensis]|nr:hypothetical protein [Chelatococcus daeguensis]